MTLALKPNVQKHSHTRTNLAQATGLSPHPYKVVTIHAMKCMTNEVVHITTDVYTEITIRIVSSVDVVATALFPCFKQEWLPLALGSSPLNHHPHTGYEKACIAHISSRGRRLARLDDIVTLLVCSSINCVLRLVLDA